MISHNAMADKLESLTQLKWQRRAPQNSASAAGMVLDTVGKEGVRSSIQGKNYSFAESTISQLIIAHDNI